MHAPIHIDTIRMELSIIYYKDVAKTLTFTAELLTVESQIYQIMVFLCR